jgi:prepilin-type processing-associated H-X9-DG protein
MSARREGLTIVELLVIVALVGLLAAILLPAVQASRETARRSQCLSNLRQLGVAMQAYTALHKIFPPSSSFQSAVLPQLELADVYSLIDYNVSSLAPENAAARAVRIPVLHCPSDGAGYETPGTNYAGNFGSGVQAFGYNGIIRRLRGFYAIGENRHATYVVTPGSVTDGLSNTAAAAEILIMLNYAVPGRGVWQTPVSMVAANQLDAFANQCESMSGPTPIGGLRGTNWLYGDQMQTGYNHVLPPNRNSCTNGQDVQRGAYTATSLHPHGVNVLAADGHASFVSDVIDRYVWRGMGSRNGGEAVPPF